MDDSRAFSPPTPGAAAVPLPPPSSAVDGQPRLAAVALPASSPSDSPWADPGASPDQPPTITFEPVVGNQTRPRRALMVSVAAACALAVGIGGFFALSGSPTADNDASVRLVVDDDASKEAFSYATATTTLDVAAAMRTSMTMSAPDMTLDATVDVDRVSQRYSMDLDMSALTDMSVFGYDNFDMTMIGDPASHTTYMSGELYSEWLGIETTWLSMTDAQGGGGFDSGEFFEPLDLTAMFVGHDPVEVGIESVDGEDLKHFTVTVPMADLLADDPDVLAGFGSADMTQLDSVTFDVWVDEASRLRRASMSEVVFGEPVAFDMRLEHLAEPIDIALPDPSDVTDWDTAIQAASPWNDINALDD